MPSPVAPVPTFDESAHAALEANIFYERGVECANEEQYQRALQNFSEAIRLSPGYAMAYSARARVFRLTEQYPRALQDYGEAIRLNAQDADAYHGRGTLYWIQDKYDVFV